MRIKTIIGAVAAIIVVGVLLGTVWYLFIAKPYKVELCMTWDGETACETARGKDKVQAQTIAMTNACFPLTGASGESFLRCLKSEPSSISWNK